MSPYNNCCVFADLFLSQFLKLNHELREWAQIMLFFSRNSLLFVYIRVFFRLNQCFLMATLINYHEGEKGAQRIKTSPQFAQNINFCALFAFVVKNFSI